MSNLNEQVIERMAEASRQRLASLGLSDAEHRSAIALADSMFAMARLTYPIRKAVYGEERSNLIFAWALVSLLAQLDVALTAQGRGT